MLARPLPTLGLDGVDITLGEAIAAAAIAAATVLAVGLLKSLARRRLRSREAEAGMAELTVLRVLSRTRRTASVVVGVYAGSLALDLPAIVERALPLAAVVAVLIQLGLWASEAINLAAETLYRKKRSEGDGATAGAVTLLAVGARALVWLLVALLVLANFGVDITALIAGLGVGGIAVALALQKVLADIFASVAIMLDKPFEVGEFIAVDEFLGEVEQVGIKTTRLKSLSGEHLVFANNDLLEARIRNYSRIREYRAVLRVGIPYDTPTEDIRRAVDILRRAIEEHGTARVDHVHFVGFGESALLYEAAYFVTSGDYYVFLDVRQDIHLRALGDLRAAGIDIAFPTQTLHLRQDGDSDGDDAADPATKSA